jgi:hypothetical protein
VASTRRRLGPQKYSSFRKYEIVFSKANRLGLVVFGLGGTDKPMDPKKFFIGMAQDVHDILDAESRVG